VHDLRQDLLDYLDAVVAKMGTTVAAVNPQESILSRIEKMTAGQVQHVYKQVREFYTDTLKTESESNDRDKIVMQQKTLYLPNVDNNTVQLLVNYMYTNKIREGLSPVQICRLCALATELRVMKLQHWGINQLVTNKSKLLEQRIPFMTVIQYTALANKAHCTELRRLLVDLVCWEVAPPSIRNLSAAMDKDMAVDVAIAALERADSKLDAPYATTKGLCGKYHLHAAGEICEDI